MKKSGLFICLFVWFTQLTNAAIYQQHPYDNSKTECKLTVKEDSKHQDYYTSFLVIQSGMVVFYKPANYNENAAHQHICGVEFPPPDYRL